MASKLRKPPTADEFFNFPTFELKRQPGFNEIPDVASSTAHKEAPMQLQQPEVPGFQATPDYQLTEPQLGASLQTSAPGFVGEFSSQLSPATTASATPSTDWGSVAGAGIGAAGQAVGTIAQIAGQKVAMDRVAESNAAGRMLSEKLAKMQLAANQEQFAREQNLHALMWALGAYKDASDSQKGARDVRRGAIEGMSDLLSKVMLRGRR